MAQRKPIIVRETIHDKVTLNSVIAPELVILNNSFHYHDFYALSRTLKHCLADTKVARYSGLHIAHSFGRLKNRHGIAFIAWRTIKAQN